VRIYTSAVVEKYNELLVHHGCLIIFSNIRRRSRL